VIPRARGDFQQPLETGAGRKRQRRLDDTESTPADPVSKLENGVRFTRLERQRPAPRENAGSEPTTDEEMSAA
jgi:hypothetical protein